jgi:oligopeptidase B
MRPLRRSSLSTLILLAAPFIGTGAQQGATQAGKPQSPPVATIAPKVDTLHGDIRVDNYAWLRDDARKRPEVISYLEAENAYTDAKSASLAPLRDKLYAEFLGRIKQTDLQVPEPYGPYVYYSRTVEVKMFPIFARTPTTPNAREEILLDRNERAGSGKFYATGATEISPDHNRMAVLEDRNGSEHFILRVKDLTTGKWLTDSLLETTYGVEWANDNKTLFYTRFDSAQRPDRIFRHHLGDDPAKDVVVAREPDDLFGIGVGKSRSKRFLFITHGSFTSSEVKYLDASTPDGEWKVIVPRTPDLEYEVEHHDDRFIIRTNADGATNFKLMTAPVSSPDRAHWKEWIAPRADAQIEEFVPFRDHYVIVERSTALRRLRIIDAATNDSHYVTMPESVYSVGVGANREYATPVLRYRYTSLVTPASVYDYDMSQRKSTLRKQDEVVGGYDKSKYATERAWAPAEDGTLVPLSIVYKKPFVRDGSRPMLLYGYGSYGINTDPNFSTNNLSLLDRGVVYAIAHIRGGQEMGRTWYDDGKMMKKRNTFTDFIAAAEDLERER